MLAWCGCPLLAIAGAPAAAPVKPIPTTTLGHVIEDAPRASLPAEFPGRAWRVFSVNDSLPDNMVYAITQDPAGLIYAGLGNGIASYDGGGWTRLPLPGVHGAHAVGAVRTTPDGAVWIGADGDGVFRLHAGRVVAVPGLAGDARVVHQIAIASGNSVWAATGGGLAHCTAQHCTLDAGLQGRKVLSVSPGGGPNGPCLWLGIADEGLRRYDLTADGRLLDSGFLFARKDGLPNSVVVTVVQWGGRDGRDLWIATGRGLARFDGRRLVRYTAAVGFPGSVTALLPGQGRDRGLLFAALKPGGLAVIRADGSWGLIGPAQGLPDSSVQALAYTGQGSGAPLLWVGTSEGGVARADPERWQLLDERRDVPTRGMAGLGRVRFLDGVETLWMGSAAGTRRLTSDGWEPVPGLPDGVTADMVDTSDGALWMATREGLWRLQGKRRELFTTDNSPLPAVYVHKLVVEHQATGDVLWIATNHGLARWSAAEGLRREVAPPLLPAGSTITAMAVAGLGDEAPDFWMATETRLLRRHHGQWQAMAGDCLRDATVTTLVGHRGPRGGELWIGTNGPVVRVRSDGCERRDGLFQGGGISQLAFDTRGQVWLFGEAGVARMDTSVDTRLAMAPMVQHGGEDGLFARDFLPDRGVAMDDRGRLWVASTAALQMIDTSYTPPPIDDARLLWQSASAGENRQPLAAGAELPAGTSPLEFSARLLAFGREGSNRYRVQLIGLHDAPLPWSSDNRFVFNRLGAGDYQVLLWGRDAEGKVVGPLRLPFRILAPWWQRSWALALWALMLVASGLLLGWWRSRSLRLRARELADEVAARTGELADANRQLEAMARTDTLTGLHNRRHALDVLPNLVHRDDRRRHDGAAERLLLVLIDVDHFKHVNDSHGHAIGDVVLQEVAQRLQGALRTGDMLVRWGGEEFLIALDGCAPAHAAGRVLALLAATSDTPVAIDGGTLRISVSAGVACYAPPEDNDLRHLDQAMHQAIARADAALYEAKRGGRDRAVLATDDVDDPARWQHQPRKRVEVR